MLRVSIFSNDLLSGGVPICGGRLYRENAGAAADGEAVSCVHRAPAGKMPLQEQVRALTERLCGEESEGLRLFFRGAAGGYSAARRDRGSCA